MSPETLEKHVLPLVVLYAPKLLGFIVALVATRMVSGWAQKLVLGATARANVDEAVAKFLSSLTKYGVLTLGFIVALGYAGVETASFAAVIAASGLAIGLAFQGTLSNFAAGVMLLVFRPFRVGDLVIGAGEKGTVLEISMFTTELRTPDNQRVIVPNSSMFGGNITNVTHCPTRRISIDVGTDYAADMDQTRTVLEQVAGGIEGVIDDPAPAVFLAGLGASSIDWQVRIWCKTEDYWDVHQRTVLAVKKGLDGAGIGIPFPQRQLHLDPEQLRAGLSARR